MEPALELDVCEYRRREPLQTLLHPVLRDHLETFLDLVRTAGFDLPWYVVKGLKEYLSCGVMHFFSISAAQIRFAS